jgi:hypothetical protein
MSEDERPQAAAQDEDEHDVEAHKNKMTATDDGADEGDDDFEAHKHRTV